MAGVVAWLPLSETFFNIFLVLLSLISFHPCVAKSIILNAIEGRFYEIIQEKTLVFFLMNYVL